jgi:hypothetical protein
MIFQSMTKRFIHIFAIDTLNNNIIKLKIRKNSYWEYVVIVGIFLLLLLLWLAIDVREKNKKNPSTEKSEQVVPK